MTRRGRSRCGKVAIALIAVALVSAVAAPSAPASHGEDPSLEHAIFVGNNWEGTADVITANPPFRRIATINVVPDIQERLFEIYTDPVRLGYFLGIRMVVGEGHDQFVDDMYTSKDGRLLVVSRPSLADVVAIDLASGEIVWRFRVDGQRSDHMGVSPDGKHVAVSASTGNVVHILDIETGEEVGSFPSGDSPHENTFSKDGERIFHASIGLVYTPADQPLLDSTKGERYFQVVDVDEAMDDDPSTDGIIERVVMGEKLDEAGYPDMSSAVRPMALSPNERFVYLQVSFFHGFVEYDLKRDRVLRVANLPIADQTKDMPRELYVLDSAHHGIAMNGGGTKLCVAGTMSDYAAIVSRKTFRYKLIRAGERSYWSTTHSNGRWCLVSWSQSDRLSVIDYETRKEIARVRVGNPKRPGLAHPQRVRMGNVRTSWLRANR